MDGSSVRVIYSGLTLLRAQSLIVDIYSVHGSGAPVFIGPGKAVTSAGCTNTSIAFSSSSRRPVDTPKEGESRPGQSKPFELSHFQ